MITGLFIAEIHPEAMVHSSGNPTLNELCSSLFSESLDPTTLMFFGLVVLMFTPVLRVVTAIIGFALERDWQFVLISFVVFLLLSFEIGYSLLIKG